LSANYNKIASGLTGGDIFLGAINMQNYFKKLTPFVLTDDIIDERDMLADENKKMATYLIYLNAVGKIDLKLDGYDWILPNDEGE